ncbi:MAG: hypothetical protein H0T42_34205 [Deltaproteobacteria bacterium]|nr:hypothetical protein [Deltaproteobacteria bacterium]
MVAALPEPGHMIPIANVVRRLIDGGHEVAWVSAFARPWRSPFDRRDDAMRDQLRAWGVTLPEWPDVPVPAWLVEAFADEAEFADRVRYRELQVLAGLELMPAPLELARSLIRDVSPDAVIVDSATPLFIAAADCEKARTRSSRPTSSSSPRPKS